MIRPNTMLILSVSVLAIGGLLSVHPTPRLIWNATPSTPTGLYTLRPVDRLQARELVAVLPPEPVASFLADGGYLPHGVPLLKHVIALPGQNVCRIGDALTIDGIIVGNARDSDHLGRPLPRWTGCHTVRPDEVFLMNPAVSDSLDGRYFGPFSTRALLGRAVPLLTDEAGDGHFTWRASDP